MNIDFPLILVIVVFGWRSVVIGFTFVSPGRAERAFPTGIGVPGS